MKTLNYPLILLAATSLALTACDTSDEPEPFPDTEEQSALNEAPSQDGMEQPYGQTADEAQDATKQRSKPETRVQAAVAVLHPTQGNDVSGTVHFTTAAGQGVQVKAQVSGLPQGVHAYHVHVYGDCTGAGAASAGPHFNFRGGARDPFQTPDRILGNLGELQADANGAASHSATAANARLNGARSILGRAVVVHAKGNDPSQPPDGAAGVRIACGVIGIAQPGMAKADAKADEAGEDDQANEGDQADEDDTPP